MVGSAPAEFHVAERLHVVASRGFNHDAVPRARRGQGTKSENPLEFRAAGAEILLVEKLAEIAEVPICLG